MRRATGNGQQATGNRQWKTGALLAFVTLAGLSGCRGKIVGTASLNGAGRSDVSFTSTGAPLVLWADTEGEWRGGKNSKLPVHYEVDVLSSGNVIGHVACDTTAASTTVCGVEVNNGGAHRGDCEYKLPCDLPTIPAGPASLHVVATLGPGASNVKKASLNVRAR